MNKFIQTLARSMALLGGFVLMCLVAITCVSVVGRLLNTIGHSAFVKENLEFLSALLTQTSPIVGDFELVEAGVAFAIMTFLPWCQLNRAHAKVEIFTGLLPASPNRFLAFVWEALFAFVLIVITWRIYVGTTDKMGYNETTFLLQYPIWWAYAACTLAAGIACVVAVYSVWLHLSELLTGQSKQTPVQDETVA